MSHVVQHLGRTLAYLLVLEAASPRENRGDFSWVGSPPRSPVPASLHLLVFEAQAKPVWFESAGASALHTLPCDFNPGDARDRNLIGRGVLITSPFLDHFVGQ